MQNKIVKIGNIDVANDKPFVLFGGMNVLRKPRYGDASV